MDVSVAKVIVLVPVLDEVKSRTRTDNFFGEISSKNGIFMLKLRKLQIYRKINYKN